MTEMSTDFPGTPRGPGDTISVAFGDLPAAAAGPRDSSSVAPVDEHDDTSRDAAALRDETPPPGDGGSLYRVSTTTVKILGHKPGTVFRAKLDPNLERRLLQRGQLERVSSGRPARPAGARSPGTTNEGGSR